VVCVCACARARARRNLFVKSRSPISISLNIINVYGDVCRKVNKSSSVLLLVMKSHIIYSISISK
jgi:hypothetical protein